MRDNALADRLLTVEEAAQYLGYAVGTLYNKVSRNEIPYVRLSRRKGLRFRKSELDRWVIEQHAEIEEEEEAEKAL